MTQFIDLMIDTETMGLPPTGALVSIGAVFFDLRTCTLGPTFNQTIHLGSAVTAGGTIDPGTVMWWLRQGDEARKAVSFNTEHITRVLTNFSEWIAETCRHEDVRPWGNGAAFDLSIVGSAYKRLGKPAPWYFGHERCFRTIYNQNNALVKYDPSDKGSGAHNALTDAIFQADHFFKIKRARTGGV